MRSWRGSSFVGSPPVRDERRLRYAVRHGSNPKTIVFGPSDSQSGTPLDPVGQARMPRAIREVCERGVAAKGEIRMARIIEGPAAAPVGEIEQRAALHALDGDSDVWFANGGRRPVFV